MYIFQHMKIVKIQFFYKIINLYDILNILCMVNNFKIIIKIIFLAFIFKKIIIKVLISLQSQHRNSMD